MNLITASRLTFAYREGGGTRLKELDLEVGRTEILGVSGDSGIGKTTLLRLIAGELTPSSGSIEWNGTRSLAYAPQADVLFDFRTAWQNATLLLERAAPRDEVDEGLEFLDRAFATLRLADSTHSPPAQLSGGMRQRVQVAQALAPRSSLLMLDEPFSEQDFEQQQAMETLIHHRVRSKKQAGILVSHDISALAALCDRILFLESRPARLGGAILPPPELGPLPPSGRRSHPAFAAFEFALWHRGAEARPA